MSTLVHFKASLLHFHLAPVHCCLMEANVVKDQRVKCLCEVWLLTAPRALVTTDCWKSAVVPGNLHRAHPSVWQPCATPYSVGVLGGSGARVLLMSRFPRWHLQWRCHRPTFRG